MNNDICTKFWAGAVLRYYGNWKLCYSYIVCHKPIKFWHLGENKLCFTIIMTFILIEGKSISYKHSLIFYWTALVSLCTCRFYIETCTYLQLTSITVIKSRFMKRVVRVEESTINRAIQRLYGKTTDEVNRRIWIQASITRRDMLIYRPTSYHSRFDVSGNNHLCHVMAANKSNIYSYQKHATVYVLKCDKIHVYVA